MKIEVTRCVSSCHRSYIIFPDRSFFYLCLGDFRVFMCNLNPHEKHLVARKVINAMRVYSKKRLMENLLDEVEGDV